MTKYGYPDERWQAMVKAGGEYLAEVAARGGDTDYTKFCEEVRRRAGFSVAPGDHALAHLLGDIGREAHFERGAVTTVLVHYKNGGSEPGPGFFVLCQELGLLPPGHLDDLTKLTFHVEQAKAVYEAYRA